MLMTLDFKIIMCSTYEYIKIYVFDYTHKIISKLCNKFEIKIIIENIEQISIKIAKDMLRDIFYNQFLYILLFTV
jgi:hypothetical protein